MDDSQKTRRNLMIISTTVFVIVFLGVEKFTIPFVNINVPPEKSWKIWILLGSFIVYFMLRYCFSPDFRLAKKKWASDRTQVYLQRIMTILSNHYSKKKTRKMFSMKLRHTIGKDRFDLPTLDQPIKNVFFFKRERHEAVEASIWEHHVEYHVFGFSHNKTIGQGYRVCSVNRMGKIYVALSEPETIWHGLELYFPIILGLFALMLTTPLPEKLLHLI